MSVTLSSLPSAFGWLVAGFLIAGVVAVIVAGVMSLGRDTRVAPPAPARPRPAPTATSSALAQYSSDRIPLADLLAALVVNSPGYPRHERTELLAAVPAAPTTVAGRRSATVR